MPRGVYERSPSNTGWCQVKGCDRPAGGLRANICEMHYYRKRRGTRLEQPPLPRYRGQSCAMEGCDRVAKARGWCHTHYTRWLRHGDPTTLDTLRPSGSENPSWRGQNIGYSAAHVRVNKRKDPGLCEECGVIGGPLGVPLQWALDHERCPEPMRDFNGPYSPDSEDYIRLCVPCHKDMDMARFEGFDTDQRRFVERTT